MRHLSLATVCIAALSLAACDSGSPPAAPEASSAAPVAAPSSEAAAPSSEAPTQAAASDDDLAPLFGTWALDPQACAQTLVISKTRFEGPKSGCDINGYSDNGDGTYTASMSCSTDGQSVDEQIVMRPIFAPSGEGIELTYLNRDNLQSTVLRCDLASASAAGN